MSFTKQVRTLAQKKWYLQSFNAVPNLIAFAGNSIPYVRKRLGYGYHEILMAFHKDYCKIYFAWADLERIAG